MGITNNLKSAISKLFTVRFIVNFALMIALTVGIIYAVAYSLKYITHHGESVVLPNYAGFSLNQAVERIKDDGFRVQIDSMVFNDKYKPLMVYKQNPIVGSIVKKGRLVVLKVNPKNPKSIAFPNLIEKSYRLAKYQLDLLRINIGKISYEPHIAKDIVLQVSYKGKLLKAGTKIPRGATVDLILGEGYNQISDLPNLYGLTVEEARELLTNKKFQLGSIVEKNVSDKSSARIFKQLPSAGTVLEQGQTVTIQITNDAIPDEEAPDKLADEEVPVTE